MRCKSKIFLYSIKEFTPRPVLLHALLLQYKKRQHTLDHDICTTSDSKDLQRAVEKARINGIKVVIAGGGSVNDSSRHGNNLDTRHVVKVGPVTYSNTGAMAPWRLPVPFIEKISGKDRLFVRVMKAFVIFCVGLTLGRATAAMRLPYRLAFVRNTE